MRKCQSCLCRTCAEVCNCQNCKGKIKECNRYSSFWQLSIFDPPPKPNRYKAPRHSWDYYGISRERYRELTEYIKSGRYSALASSAAYTANKDIAEYILLSVKKNKSWEKIEYVEGLGRIPCGRTDFYGYRRYFISIFDKELRRIGK